MSDTLKLGNLVSLDNYGKKDAVHIAVAAVEANERLSPGDHVGLLVDGKASMSGKSIGIVDPFLKCKVMSGDKFWLYLYPGSVTSLAHHWTHPDFTGMDKVNEEAMTRLIKNFPSEAEKVKISKDSSEEWMRKWASTHMGEDYYGNGKLSEYQAYRKAVDAGHNLSVGPYESARDYIDDTWWSHWEIITNCKRPPENDCYFSCGC